MSAERHIPDKNNGAFTSRVLSVPISTQWLKLKPSRLNNTEIQAYTSVVFLLHQQINFFPHSSSAVSVYGERLWGKKRRGSKPLCASAARTQWITLDSWKLVRQKWRHPRSESEPQCVPWMNFLFQSVTYRVSPAQPHTGSESHLFTSRLQVADSWSPRVTGRGGGQISFWNFNLLQLNYLISEPHTSKEYLSSLLPGCLDGGFHFCLLKDSLILYLYPAVWMTLYWNLLQCSLKSDIHCTNKPQCIKTCGSWRWNYSVKLQFSHVFIHVNFGSPTQL